MNTFYMILLSGHILSGVGSIIGYGSYVLQDKCNLKKLNVALFALNAVSGGLLLLTKPQSTAHFCAGLAGYVLIIALIKYYGFIKAKNVSNID